MAPSSRMRSRRTCLLLGLLGLAALLASWAPPHLHESETAGYYNEAHVLTSLATRAGDASLPGPGPAAWAWLMAFGLAGWFAAALPALRPRRAHCRAPPLAAPLSGV